jgi:hypothetical protein
VESDLPASMAGNKNKKSKKVDKNKKGKPKEILNAQTKMSDIRVHKEIQEEAQNRVSREKRKRGDPGTYTEATKDVCFTNDLLFKSTEYASVKKKEVE